MKDQGARRRTDPVMASRVVEAAGPGAERGKAGGALECDGENGGVMRKFLLIGWGICVAFTAGLYWGRWFEGWPPSGSPPRSREDEKQRAAEQSRGRVKHLIEMLASRNPEPVLKGRRPDQEVHFAATHDSALQAL